MEGRYGMQGEQAVAVARTNFHPRYRWKRLRREFEPSYLGRHQQLALQ